MKNWNKRPILSRIGVLLLVGGLAACSSNFLYNRLDSFVVWEIGRYVSLESAQKAELKQRVREDLDSIRQFQFPQAAAVLMQSSADVRSGDVTPELLDIRYQQMLGLLDQFMLSVVPVSAWFLLSLDEQQVAELFTNLDELNQEMYEDYSGETAEERRKNRNKSSIKAVKRFTGRLTDEQKLLITQSLESMTDSSEQWIEYQREWQQRFKLLVEAPPPGPEFQAELTTLFVYPRSFHSAEYTAAVNANRAILNVMLAELINGLSDKQRERMIDKIEGYAATLSKLAAADNS